MPHISRWRYILQALNGGLLLGTVIWVVLNIRGAQVLKDQTRASTYEIAFGPVTLMQLHKQPIDSGFTVQFSLEPGLIIYVVFWLVMSAVLGLAVGFYIQTPSRKS